MKKFFPTTLLCATLLVTGCRSDVKSEINSSKEEVKKTINRFQKEIRLGTQPFRVEIADTPELREQGLMFREKLEPGTGMLFVFESSDIHAFWMKNTLIPLDIAWIDENKKIVDIQHMTPCTSDPCQTYKPQAPAKYVLEVNNESLLSHIGDELSF